MKKTIKMWGITALLAVIGFTMIGCASLFGGAKDWDRSVPKTEAACLHFGSQAKLIAVDGQGKGTGPLAVVYPGDGGMWHYPETKRDLTKDAQAKAIVRIPSGTHELTFEMPGPTPLSKAEEFKITYDFTAGRHYYFAVDEEKSISQGVEAGLEGLKDMSLAKEPWEFRDVTEKKWAK